MPQKFEYTVLDMLESAMRTVKTTPLNLGGLAGGGGGVGGPPGGFIGWLPQTRVAYDSTEAATLATPSSGMSLLDNLNHIRYRINTISGGSITVMNYNGSPTITPVTTIRFSGATVSSLGGGVALVSISSSGGGTNFVVEDWDGSPSVSNPTRIVFSGLTVTNPSTGRVVITNTASATLSGITGGNPNRVVATDSTGKEMTLDWLSHSAGNRYLKWGADQVGDTADSGKIAYNTVEHYLDIYGEGPTVPRKVRVRETLYVDSELYVFGTKIDPLKQVTGGDTHDHNGGDGDPIDHSFLTGAGTYSHSDLELYIRTGWWPCPETWTRTGNHTFTVSGDVRDKYRKGTRLRYRDGGGVDEFGIVGSVTYSSPNTTVNLIPNTDYAMAAATITDKYISNADLPELFPHWFNYNANPQGFSVVPSSPQYQFTTHGHTQIVTYQELNNGTSNATTFTASLPVAAASTLTAVMGTIVNNGTTQTTSGRVVTSAGSTTITFRTDMNLGAWTNANGKRAIVVITADF